MEGIRYYISTAYVVMQMVKDKINKFAKEHNINYQV